MGGGGGSSQIFHIPTKWSWCPLEDRSNPLHLMWLSGIKTPQRRFYFAFIWFSTVLASFWYQNKVSVKCVSLTRVAMLISNLASESWENEFFLKIMKRILQGLIKNYLKAWDTFWWQLMALNCSHQASRVDQVKMKLKLLWHSRLRQCWCLRTRGKALMKLSRKNEKGYPRSNHTNL